MAMDAVWSGDFAATTSLIAEIEAICEATGSRVPPYPAMYLTGLQGREAEGAPLIQATIKWATTAGQGGTVTRAYWTAAILYNGLGRHKEALAAARQASENAHPHMSPWALPELIEAAIRVGSTDIASDALDRLAQTTRAVGTEDALGIEARSLVHHGLARSGKDSGAPVTGGPSPCSLDLRGPA